MFNKMNNKKILSLMVVGTMFSVVACKNDPLSPGLEYMPDMYRSVAYETYDRNPNVPDSMSAQSAPSNTIPRGFQPYAYPNTPEGYEAAGVNLVGPAVDEKMENEGKELYTKMCKHCHGEKGDGAGTIKVNGEAFPVPSYYDAAHINLPDGKMFHTLTYGKGLMGGHASQLSKDERWKLVAYVNKLQRDNTAGAPSSAAPADSTKK